MSVYENYSDIGNYIYLRKQGEPFSADEIYKISCLPNFHKAPEFIFVTGGSMCCNVNGKTGKLEKGDILFVDSFLPHSYTTSDDIEGYILVLSEWYFLFFRHEYAGKTLPMILDHREKNKPVMDFVAEWHKHREEGTSYEQFNRANVFLAMLCKEYAVAPIKIDKGNELVLNILNYIEEHYQENISLESIADHLGYVKQYCSRMFNKVMGESFRKYLNQVRISKFSEMSEATKTKKSWGVETVLKLAFDCGFESQATFYRAYKEVYGTTPRMKKREQNKKEELP